MKDLQKKHELNVKDIIYDDYLDYGYKDQIKQIKKDRKAKIEILLNDVNLDDLNKERQVQTPCFTKESQFKIVKIEKSFEEFK
jgi:hypothetical protein